MEKDADSIFSYDGEAESNSFSLSLLTAAVAEYFQTPCQLVKLAEGGFHKVYDVVRNGTVDAVVRVARPAFPKDKLESEVATIRYLASHTSVPVPRVYSWNSDASNPAGIEYMIMEKVSGVPADSVLESLSGDALKRLVAELAAYYYEIFSLRFEQAGSLYHSSTPDKFSVGPIVSTPFYRALDGSVRIDDASLHERLRRGQQVLEILKELCEIYPGDTSVYEGATTPAQRFSLRLDDFRLSNVMIDKESGKVIAFIDFEGATIAPLWDCAMVPHWILPSYLEESSGFGLPKHAREALYMHFIDVINRSDGSGEWHLAHTKGRPFRLLIDHLQFYVGVWEDEECRSWVDSRLSWAKMHPGVGFPDDTVWATITSELSRL
ncbi:Protein kinase-like domain containing protein [Amanita muscaria]